MSRWLAMVVIGLLVSSCQTDETAEPKPTPTPTPIPNPIPPDPVDPSPLAKLPKDTGGTHAAKRLGSDASPYGYYIYTPSGYSASGPKFPLLIFLHGAGQIGNSQISAPALDSVLDAGPPYLIERGDWDPKYPMVVVSAQCHDAWWNPNKVRQLIEFLMATYQVDETRVYLTGLSMGGYATYDQLMYFGADSHIAAAVVISGGGTLNVAGTQKASQVPLWSFHGENDRTVFPQFTIAFIDAINDTHPATKAKLTMYPGVGHDSWTETYDGSGMGKEDPAYDPFDQEVYTWMMGFSK